MTQMRIQKYLSINGICSRRKAEEYIERWCITINGVVAKIGQSVDTEVDKVVFWEQAIQEQKEMVYYKLNKPRWIVTTCASHGETNILDIVDIPQRVFPIGRLDKETCGLILLTNDGRLANYLMHPRFEHEKEYLVETFWPVSDESLERMRNGIYILWSYTKKARIVRISSGKFTIILTEWRNRQIRRMVEKIGSEVKKLKRIRIENIELWNLQEWEYKKLTPNEKKQLFEKLWINQN